jgi:hypothetical protein
MQKTLTTHNTQERQTTLPPAEFEPAIPVIELLQTCASDRVAIGISYRVMAPRIYRNRHMEVVRLLVLATGSQYASPLPTGTHFCKRQSRPQGHITAGKDYDNEEFQ